MMSTAAFPARCALSIVCGGKLVSQVYPALVPVEAFIDNAIELLDEDLKRHGAPGLDVSIRYELQRTNGTRLDITKTLADLGVEDGATLVLAEEEGGDSFEPQLESLSTSLARIGQRLFPPVTAATAADCAAAILAMTSLSVLILALWVRWRFEESMTGISVLLIGLALSGSAVAVHRWYPERRELLDRFAWLAIPAVAAGFAMAVPGPLGAAHAFIAFLTVAVSTAIVTGLSGRHFARGSAVAALALLGVLIAGLQEWLAPTTQRLGVLGLLAVLCLVTVSPTVALWVARIRPPYFGSITGRDIFRRNDGMPADSVAPIAAAGGDDPNVDTTPTAGAVVGAALRANGVLTGLCGAAAFAAPIAAWVTLVPGARHTGAAVALVLVFVLIFIKRARAFSDRRQAMALVLGAAAMLCAVAACRVIYAQGSSAVPFVWSAIGLTIFAATGLAAALLVPVTRFTPLVRMLTEWVELAAIVVALPLSALICDLFTWVRMR